MWYVHRSLALCAICFLLLTASAQGQASQQPDPDTPAGVEYQLPLEQARDNASGGSGDRASSGRNRAGHRRAASLFGAGVVPAGASDNAAGGGGTGGTGSADGADGADGAARSDPASGAGGRPGDAGASTPRSSPIKPAVLDAPDDDEGSATLRIAGIALAVLLAGALLGLVLRRGLTQSGD